MGHSHLFTNTKAPSTDVLISLTTDVVHESATAMLIAIGYPDDGTADYREGGDPAFTSGEGHIYLASRTSQALPKESIVELWWVYELPTGAALELNIPNSSGRDVAVIVDVFSADLGMSMYLHVGGVAWSGEDPRVLVPDGEVGVLRYICIAGDSDPSVHPYTVFDGVETGAIDCGTYFLGAQYNIINEDDNWLAKWIQPEADGASMIHITMRDLSSGVNGELVKTVDDSTLDAAGKPAPTFDGQDVLEVMVTSTRQITKTVTT